ncbi:hypothetical protein FB45DRAFT_59683 [Roridomyces roridus]|uniref:HECT-type E3 ubiquitin transferase n=1 Tax=Roridomyces roridus TaxID=1738132 RepID=A0AAD7FM37_9AGAR|nr:hypothetical protein FB45DRAFT_59683 [Roridomyces roridus]
MVLHCLSRHEKKIADWKKLGTMDRQIYGALTWMLNNDITDITYQTFSMIDKRVGVTVDLVLDGRKIFVTEENKEEYIDATVAYITSATKWPVSSPAITPDLYASKKKRRWNIFGGSPKPTMTLVDDEYDDDEPTIRARALHTYIASPDDPNELSFERNEILEIKHQASKWWRATKKDGAYGIVPANYLAVLPSL